MVNLMLILAGFALVLLGLIAKAIINLEIKGCLNALILWFAKFAAEALGDEPDEEHGYLADVREELKEPTFRPLKLLWDNALVAAPVLWQRSRNLRTDWADDVRLGVLRLLAGVNATAGLVVGLSALGMVSTSNNDVAFAVVIFSTVAAVAVVEPPVRKKLVDEAKRVLFRRG